MFITVSSCTLVLCTVMITVTGSANSNNGCPLWHSFSDTSKKCECCNTRVVQCEISDVSIVHGYCMTWNNVTHNVEVSRCLFTHKDDLCKNYSSYGVLTNLSGPELNYFTCNSYNRQGSQCRQCTDGYGPAPFSDGVTCADCSIYKHLWILTFLFQLIMVTLMYLAVVLFGIKGTSSPLNIVITYCQLGLNAVMVGTVFHARLVCFTGHKLDVLILTLLGVWNLDFFHFVIPPLCVSTSLKVVHILLFDYIIAFYPLVLTVFIYVGIELHDRNCQIIVYLCTPLRMILHGNWNPKETILNTCATFLLLSYSKFLFVSINLLLGIPSFNCNGDVIPNSTALLYDPTIRFFHSEHIPYVVLSLSVFVIVVLLPPLFLLLYPTRLFRKCLSCCGFRRWDILHLIMDIFQGWYKDGTDSVTDYRALSALYMILRVMFTFIFITILISHFNTPWLLFGLFHVFLGTFFLIVKPYKMKWMSHADGLILNSFGILMLMKHLEQRFSYILGFVIGLLMISLVSVHIAYKWIKKLLFFIAYGWRVSNLYTVLYSLSSSFILHI